MSNSLLKIPNGPVWPLGPTVVITPGTPVNIMSLVDPNSVNAPETLTSTLSYEYTIRAQQIVFQAYRAGASAKLQTNTGYIYVVMKNTTGNGGTTDIGIVVATLQTGTTFTLTSSSLNRNVFNPYEFYIDADNASDGAMVTLIMQ